MLNTIALMGRLVRDPELKQTANGLSVAQLTIACERSFTKAGEARQTDFIDIVCWRQTAEFACKYFSKGQLIAVNGSLQTRTYEDKEGKKRKVYEVLADNLHFAEGKKSGSGYEAEPIVEPSGARPAATPAPKREPKPEDFTVIDDSEDLPF